MTIYGIKKDGTDEHICRAAMETQTQITDLWTWGAREGEGGTNGESSMGTYTLPYISSVQSLSRVRLFATP